MVIELSNLAVSWKGAWKRSLSWTTTLWAFGWLACIEALRLLLGTHFLHSSCRGLVLDMPLTVGLGGFVWIGWYLFLRCHKGGATQFRCDRVCNNDLYKLFVMSWIPLCGWVVCFCMTAPFLWAGGRFPWLGMIFGWAVGLLLLVEKIWLGMLFFAFPLLLPLLFIIQIESLFSVQTIRLMSIQFRKVWPQALGYFGLGMLPLWVVWEVWDQVTISLGVAILNWSWVGIWLAELPCILLFALAARFACQWFLDSSVVLWGSLYADERDKHF